MIEDLLSSVEQTRWLSYSLRMSEASQSCLERGSEGCGNEMMGPSVYAVRGKGKEMIGPSVYAGIRIQEVNRWKGGNRRQGTDFHLASSKSSVQFSSSLPPVYGSLSLPLRDGVPSRFLSLCVRFLNQNVYCDILKFNLHRRMQIREGYSESEYL